MLILEVYWVMSKHFSIYMLITFSKELKINLSYLGTFLDPSMIKNSE